MKKLLAGLIMLFVLLTGCSSVVKDEKQSFIDATVEATCMIFQSENIFDPALETQTKDIYKKYGFNADDDAEMEALTKKYESDTDVQAAITKALEDCSAEFSEAFKDMFTEGATTEGEAPAPAEEGATAETPVEEVK